MTDLLTLQFSYSGRAMHASGPMPSLIRESQLPAMAGLVPGLEGEKAGTV